MAAATENQAKISLKIMVHKKKNRVLFAKADSDFVDILFSFMTLPLGTIVRIFEKRQDEKLEPLGSLIDKLVSESSGSSRETPCDHCGKLMEIEIEFKSCTKKGSDGSVFVSDVTTFIVTDDLRVIPNTSGFTIQLLCDLGATDTSQLEEKAFDIDLEQSLWEINGNRNRIQIIHCGKLMEIEIEFKSCTKKGSDGSVFVSDVTTFIVTDDLRVIPNTLGFTIQLLCDLGATDTSQLEEKAFDIDLEQYPLTYMVLSHKHLMQNLVNPKQRTAIGHLTKNHKAAISKQMALKVTLRKSDFSSKYGYIKSQYLKDMLIQPQLACRYVSQNQIFPLNVSNGSLAYCYSYSYYGCGFRDITYDTTTTDPAYKEESFSTLILKDPRVQGRYLKAPAKFLLTDDLVLTPLSTFSTVAMLNKLKVPLNDVEEHEVTIGIEEGLKILRSSLKSSSVLSAALLKGTPKTAPQTAAFQQQIKQQNSAEFQQHFSIIQQLLTSNLAAFYQQFSSF
ncbi:hypothetical protein Tco_0099606 [Tanacetum coccineum]